MDKYREHQALVNRLASTDEPAIVVAASGMCEGGRIVNYLEALLPDEKMMCCLQAIKQKTLGRAIKQRDPAISIDEQRILENAQVHTMSGCSGHAGRADLLRCILGITNRKPCT